MGRGRGAATGRLRDLGARLRDSACAARPRLDGRHAAEDRLPLPAALARQPARLGAALPGGVQRVLGRRGGGHLDPPPIPRRGVGLRDLALRARDPELSDPDDLPDASGTQPPGVGAREPGQGRNRRPRGTGRGGLDAGDLHDELEVHPGGPRGPVREGRADRTDPPLSPQLRRALLAGDPPARRRARAPRAVRGLARFARSVPDEPREGGLRGVAAALAGALLPGKRARRRALR